jgi:hypothetical protein
VAAVAEGLTVGPVALDAAAELDAVLVAVAVAVESDECLEVSSAVGAVVGSGSAVGVAVAVADGVGVAVALGVAVVEVPVEVEVLVCALTTTPGATSVEVDVAPSVPGVVVVADGSVVDCVDEPVVAGSGFDVPVEPVEVESVVDELDEDVESVVVSADATP